MTKLTGLNPDEQKVLAIYQDPKRSGMERAIRLSIQYAIGAGIFVYLAIHFNNPWYSLVVYVVFLLYMVIRLVRGKKLAGIMPGIIAKYERRIEELEALVSQGSKNG
jgi:hypothetical protein